jgi:hypothetical protein
VALTLQEASVERGAVSAAEPAAAVRPPVAELADVQLAVPPQQRAAAALLVVGPLALVQVAARRHARADAVATSGFELADVHLAAREAQDAAAAALVAGKLADVLLDGPCRLVED